MFFSVLFIILYHFRRLRAIKTITHVRHKRSKYEDKIKCRIHTSTVIRLKSLNKSHCKLTIIITTTTKSNDREKKKKLQTQLSEQNRNERKPKQTDFD